MFHRYSGPFVFLYFFRFLRVFLIVVINEFIQIINFEFRNIAVMFCAYLREFSVFLRNGVILAFLKFHLSRRFAEKFVKLVLMRFWRSHIFAIFLIFGVNALIVFFTFFHFVHRIEVFVMNLV